MNIVINKEETKKKFIINILIQEVQDMLQNCNKINIQMQEDQDINQKTQ